jgi:hypothetical protein
LNHEQSQAISLEQQLLQQQQQEEGCA